MKLSSFTKKFLLIALFLTVAVSPTAAEWELTVADHAITDSDSIFTSEGQNSVVLVEVRTERGEPINESSVTDSSEFLYTYNSSQGTSMDLQHYHGAYWYAEFQADQTKHGMASNNAEILFEAQGDRDTNDGINSNGWQEASQLLKIGNYTVDIVEGPGSEVVPGERINMTVNVSLRNTGENVNNSDVYAFFRNGSWSQEGNIDFTYNDTTKLYDASLIVPGSYSQEYLMRVVANNRSGRNPISNAQGSVSRFVQTPPELDGEIVNFTGLTGCDSASPLASVSAICEPGGSVDTKLNVTGAEVDNVTLSAYKQNILSAEDVEVYNTTMESSQGLYQAVFEVPEINTSDFRGFDLEYKLNKGDRTHVIQRSIGYSPLDIRHIGNLGAAQGQAYELSFQTVKPISLSPYGAWEVDNLVANVSDPSGDLFASYNASNLTFNEEEMAYEREVQIPDNAEAGGWSLKITGSLYAYTVTENSGFSVADSAQTLEINDTTFRKEEEGIDQFNLTVRNLQDSNRTIQVNLSESLQGEVEVNDTFNISAMEKMEIPVTVNLTDYEDVTGQVNITDTKTGFTHTAELTVDVRKCEFRSGTVCSLESEWINMTAENRGLVTADVEFLNTGEEATNLTTSVEGNISDLIDLGDRYLLEDNLNVQVNYTVEIAGNYTGSITFNTSNGSELVFNTTLQTAFSAVQESGLSTSPKSLDLGAFPSGDTIRESINVQNTGDLDLQNVEASSSEFSVSLNVTDLNVSSDSVRTVDLVFEDITSSEGNVTLTGNTSEGEVTTELSVNGTPVQNYGEMTDEISSRIENLRPVRGSNLTRTLTEVSGSITEIETAWDEGDYIESKNLYQQAQNRLDYVANNKQPTTTGGDDDDEDDPGNTGGDSPDGPDGDTGGGQDNPGTTQQDEGGGGLPIIPIVVVVVVLIVIGFVVYESYIPEEGDPLYGVLGDGQ